MCMCVRLPDDGREEDGSFSGSAAAAAAYNVQVFSSILLLVTSRGACSHGLAPPRSKKKILSYTTNRPSRRRVMDRLLCLSDLNLHSEIDVDPPLICIRTHVYTCTVQYGISPISSTYTEYRVSFDALLFQKATLVQ